MHDRPARLERRSSCKAAFVIAGCAALLSCLWPTVTRAVEPRNGSRSASLSVSATVLHTCTVETPALVVIAGGATTASSIAMLDEQVSLDCSYGDRVSVQAGLRERDAESFVQAELAQHESDAARAARSAGASEPVVITVLF